MQRLRQGCGSAGASPSRQRLLPESQRHWAEAPGCVLHVRCVRCEGWWLCGGGGYRLPDGRGSRGAVCGGGVRGFGRDVLPLTPVPSPLPGARGAMALLIPIKPQRSPFAATGGEGGQKRLPCCGPGGGAGAGGGGDAAGVWGVIPSRSAAMSASNSW